MAKDDDRTNEPEEAGKWGTAGKSSGKNNKNGKGKESKTDRRIDKVLQLAADRIDTIDSSASVPERLARAAKSSELLSAVWSLPPAQRLMFHHGMQVTDVEGDSTPGFDGNKEDAEKFISISSSEIARYQRLMYANGVKGSTRRLLIVLQGMDASGKGGIVRDPQVHRAVLEDVLGFLPTIGLTPLGLTVSPIKGMDGNTEFLLLAGWRTKEPAVVPDLAGVLEIAWK